MIHGAAHRGNIAGTVVQQITSVGVPSSIRAVIRIGRNMRPRAGPPAADPVHAGMGSTPGQLHK